MCLPGPTLSCPPCRSEYFAIRRRQLRRARAPARDLLPLPHVQFWETENSGRLDRSHRGSHRRDIPCLVDASDVRTVNAPKKPYGGLSKSYRELQQW